MVNRYNLMKASLVTDTVGKNEAWPDPLSVNWASIDYSLPTMMPVNEQFMYKPYLLLSGFYPDSSSISGYDDIILNINNISHVSTVLDVDAIALPSFQDVNTFMQINIKANT